MSSACRCRPRSGAASTTCWRISCWSPISTRSWPTRVGKCIGSVIEGRMDKRVVRWPRCWYRTGRSASATASWPETPTGTSARCKTTRASRSLKHCRRHLPCGSGSGRCPCRRRYLHRRGRSSAPPVPSRPSASPRNGPKHQRRHRKPSPSRTSSPKPRPARQRNSTSSLRPMCRALLSRSSIR